MEDKVIDVKSCARCGEDHDNLTFTALLQPQAEWSHWAECRNTKEPIMLAIVDDEITCLERVVKYVEDTTEVRTAFILLLDRDRDHSTIYSRDGIDKIGLEEMERLSKGLADLSHDFSMRTMRMRCTQDSDKWRPMETKGSVCPKRMTDMGGATGIFFLEDGKDHWRADDTCTYCGSLDPEKVIEIMENGGRHEKAKGYKGYVTSADGKVAHQKFYIDHFTREQVERLNDLI